MQKSKPAQTKNLLNKTISHSRKKRLCESLFAYCVNHSSTYLCTPVGAVSLSACVSQRLQRVEKYFFDTLRPPERRSCCFVLLVGLGFILAVVMQHSCSFMRFLFNVHLRVGFIYIIVYMEI